MHYQVYERWKKISIDDIPVLSVVIPTYNEEERIIPTIGAFASQMADLGLDWELIISDDGSKDQTIALVEELDFKNMRILKAPKNEGKGSAVRRGVLDARGKYILFADADNSTPVEEIEKFLHKMMDEDYDIAIGSRAAEGATETSRSLLRRTLSNTLRFMVRNVFKLQVRDTQCGFKMYKRDVAYQLHSAQTLDGFSFDLEILYLAAKLRYRIAEIPVNWVNAPFSKVDSFKVTRNFLRDLIKIKLNDMRGVYAKIVQLRIAIITTYPPGTGSLNEYAYHFVRFLQNKTTVDEILLLTDELPASQPYPNPNLGDRQKPLTRILPCWQFNSWKNMLRILSTLRKEKPDVILFNVQFATFGSNKVVAFLGLLTPVLAQRMGFPTMILLHNLMDTIDLGSLGLMKSLEPIFRFFGAVCTQLLLTTQLVAVTIPKYVELLEKKYRAKNVVLIPHGSFEEVPAPHQEQKNEEFVIMTFGKFGTYKRVELLIEAFKILQEERKCPMKLVIAGTDNPNKQGYLASVQQCYKNVPNVHFTGYVAEEDVACLFEQATLVVFPYTSTTGSSGVLHQAGQYGKAVVLPNLGDLAEVMKEEGYTGKFFEPESAMSLAWAIASLLDNPEERYDIGQQNYAAANGLPIDDIIDWYLFHFQHLLESKSKREKRSLLWK